MGPHAFTPVRHWDPAPIPSDPNLFNFFTAHNSTAPSARKLASSFRQGQHHRRASKMNRGVHISGVGARDRMHLRHRNSRPNGVKGASIDPPILLRDPLPGVPDQPEGEDCLRKLKSGSRSKHHPLIQKSDYAPVSVSPSSGNSMEVMSHNSIPSSPCSLLNPKERLGDAHYCLQTSTELLKVMNRIWNLEEDHASNGALINSLKVELENARRRIKELVRDRHERDELMNKIAEDKLVRKSKEHGMLRAVTQSLKEELEGERELRHGSEILHRKLVRELSEVRCSLAHALRDAEKERESRKLLEDLCDEFAWGIKNYENELRAIKSSRDFVRRTDADRLILRVSELWLDERVRIRLRESELGRAESNSVVNKLEFEIRKFLKSSQNFNSCASNRRSSACGRNSMESVPMNEAVSAPRDVAEEEEEEDESECSDSHCFDLNRRSNGDFNMCESEAAADDDLIGKAIRPIRPKKKLTPNMSIRSGAPGFAPQPNRSMKLQQVADDQEARAGEGDQAVRIVHRKSDGAERHSSARRKADGIHGSTASSMCALESLIQVDQAPSGRCASRRKSSPVREWMTKLLTPADLDPSESSTKLPRNLKENSLKAKLLEERQEQLHKDVARAARFYSEGLNFTVNVCTLRWAELQSGPLKLALMQSPNVCSDHVMQKGYSSLLSFTVTDINSTITKLMALGAELDGPIKYEIHGKVASVRCMDGHLLGLYEPA